MIQVNVHEAKTHLSRYLEQAENGEVIIVCRHNKPIAEIRAVAAVPPPVTRKAGLLKGLISWSPDAFAPMTDAEVAEFDGVPV